MYWKHQQIIYVASSVAVNICTFIYVCKVLGLRVSNHALYIYTLIRHLMMCTEHHCRPRSCKVFLRCAGVCPCGAAHRMRGIKTWSHDIPDNQHFFYWLAQDQDQTLNVLISNWLLVQTITISVYIIIAFEESWRQMYRECITMGIVEDC